MTNNINFVQVKFFFFSKNKNSFFDLDINENPILRKTITIQNTGNMKAIIHDIFFGRSKCSGQGFSASSCTNIEIDSYDKYDLKIL